MTRTLCLAVLGGLFVGAASQASPPPALYPIDWHLPGPESIYTPLLLKQLKNWPPQNLSYGSADGNPVQLECIETPGQRFFIGLSQAMTVNASLEQVARVLNDFEHYQQIFPGFDKIQVVSREGNRIVTFWEQHIPVFFIPNVKYEVTYLVDSSQPDHYVYRYQLEKGDKIKSDDGLIVLDRVLDPHGQPRTRYTEFDFDNADWGPLTTFAPGRIWKDSVEGFFLSDVAIKLKAENPDWTYDRIRKESKKALERYPVDRVLEKRRFFTP